MFGVFVRLNKLQAHRFGTCRGLSTFVDWRVHNVVTPVKHQGQSSSCWATAAVASIESAHKIATGELLNLSVQQILDCNRFNRNGSKGGYVEHAFDHVMDNGIVEERFYPYSDIVGECKPMIGKRHIFIDGFNSIQPWNDEILMEAVARQPVVVGINASVAFQMYRGGILRGECSAVVNHFVLVVGYRFFCGETVWIIKNSWGKNWGMGGYAYMQRFVDFPYGIIGPYTPHLSDHQADWFSASVGF